MFNVKCCLIYCITLQIDPKNVQSEATLLDLYRSRTLRPRTLIIYSYWYFHCTNIFQIWIFPRIFQKWVENTWNVFHLFSVSPSVGLQQVWFIILWHWIRQLWLETYSWTHSYSVGTMKNRSVLGTHFFILFLIFFSNFELSIWAGKLKINW